MAESSGSNDVLHGVSLVVLWYHGAVHVDGFLDGLESQGSAPEHIVFIDSSNDSVTSELLDARGYAVTRLLPHEFDHGSARNLGIELSAQLGAEIVVMMSQDAVLASTWALLNLVNGLDDLGTGAVFGRQLPRRGATNLERVLRSARYPADLPSTSLVPSSWMPVLSNAFAAYRLSALVGIGGFVSPMLFGEDAIAGIQLRTQGWSLNYVTEATVFHSHPLRSSTEFSRYFDIGASKAYGLFPASYAGVGGGCASVLHDVGTIRLAGLRREYLSYCRIVPYRIVGYLAGRFARVLPLNLGLRLSYSPSAFRRVHSLQIA